MERRDELEADLSFVRDAVTRSERGGPAGIPILWAVLILVGFGLQDFAPGAVPVYWAVAAPGGWVVSLVVGLRWSRRVGQLERQPIQREALHWGAMLLAMVLLAPLVWKGGVTPESAWALIVLIMALSYFLAGTHMHSQFRWIGLLMAVGYLLLLVVPAYASTLSGVVVATGLFATAFEGARGRGRAES